MGVNIKFILMEDKDPFYVIEDGNGNIYEESKHWKALKLVSDLGDNEIYDETYEAYYQIENGNILNLKLPFYLEIYRERYLNTFRGLFTEEPLQYDEDYEFV